ncbi:hypothetical protein PV433_03210 [Paenibacillus sp. GYB004]|uniref:hypothetical protein n=1 Tax=Paenibacillus sp. GYB004 TaxID=2994393 RepID=UPI002F96A933
MGTERNYDFRKRLDVVHKPDRRDPDVKAAMSEVEITADWSIVLGGNDSAFIRRIAADLQDYLYTSMNVAIKMEQVPDLAETASSGERVIVLATKETLPEFGASLGKSRSYRIAVTEEKIVLCGFDDRGVGQGSYYLEDLMNLKEAPIVQRQDERREPLFAPRMIHSGYGKDLFPDAHLNALAHAGIDAILVFATDLHMTPGGPLDFNDLIDRADQYGLDVYMYSYLPSRVHPEDPGAEEYYDGTYGRIFQACPRFKGVILVGESCEFPSKDPNTTGVPRRDWPKDKPKTKPSPGWWPCYDYPQWLNLLKKVIRKHTTDVDIVFWTYNWGYAPEEERLKLIRILPQDITLMATFEMFEQYQHVEGVTHRCVDYTASFEGPGVYFASEAQAARERGLRLYTMANTGGLTWDIGVIPYEPIPYQWDRRHTNLIRANRDWGLSGLMESHHFGWWPSFVSDLAKWAYWEPKKPVEDLFAAVARRDFSAEAVPHVLNAWRHWSDGIRDYIPTNEDQYGPFRIGPSYPLTFREKAVIPHDGYVHFILDYHSAGKQEHPLDFKPINVEIRYLSSMLAKWESGNACLEKAMALIPERKRADAELLLNLNRFIVNCVRTTIHTKEWWKWKQQLFHETDSATAAVIADQMIELAKREIANAEATIPLVEMDSRLGWEPSMLYMTDAEHLQWKLEQVRTMLANELTAYRAELAQT